MPNNCAAIVIAAKHHELTKVKDTRGTTHTVGALRCRFDFRTDDWLHSAKTAMFCKGDALLHPEVANDAIAVPLDDDDECAVPYEVLVDELPYSVGVWGVTDSGLRIVSRWLVFGAQLGCYTDGNAPADPEPTIYEQILSTAQQAVKAADAVTERADSGEFIGASAYQVAVQQGYKGTEAEWLESLVGDNGVGIIKSEINTSGELVITYSDGKIVNLGVVVGKDGTKIVVDDVLSMESVNPVQNKVVTDRIVRVESGVSAAHTFAINAQGAADKAQETADKAQETARLAGEEAYGVKNTIYYDISPRLEAVEADVAELQDGGAGANTLIVHLDEDTNRASHTSEQIFDHVSNGGTAMFYDGDMYYNLDACIVDMVTFTCFCDDYINYHMYIDNAGHVCNTDLSYVSADNFSTLDDRVSALEENGANITVDTALDANSENPVQNKVITSAFNEALEGIEGQFAAIAESLPPDAADADINDQALVVRDGKWVISDAPICTQADFYELRTGMGYLAERMTGLETTTGEMASSISGAKAIAQSANTTANTAKSTAEAAQLEVLKANKAIGDIDAALDNILDIQQSLIDSVLPSAEEVGF